MTQPSFTQSVARNIRLIPRVALALMFAVAVVFALIDVAWWDLGWRTSLDALWLLLPYWILISAADYLAVTSIVGVRRSWTAYLRFAFTSVLVVLPLLIAIGLLFAGPILGKDTALFLFLAGTPIAIVLAAFLPAWPVAQAFSSRLVVPTRIVRATRGFRWGLVGMALVLGAINRQDLIPSVNDAHDLGHAFAYAAGEAGINAVSMIYTAALAATAFIFACRNDVELSALAEPSSTKR